MHNDTHKHQRFDFIVKFSPSVCVAVVASLTGEMAAQSFAYNALGTADSLSSGGGKPERARLIYGAQTMDNSPSIIPKFG